MSIPIINLFKVINIKNNDCKVKITPEVISKRNSSNFIKPISINSTCEIILISKLIIEKGSLALKQTFQLDIRHKNRTAEAVEKTVVDFLLTNPHLEKMRVSAQLKTNSDMEISLAGVRYIWLRKT